MRQQNSNGGRRPRGRTNNRKQHSGGQSRSGTYDSNGPDGRIRGNASQVYEKYVGLARDATSASDRIAAEAYYQHAEHYYRIVNDSTDPESPGSQRAHSAQPNAASQATGDVEGNQAVSQAGQPGRNHQERPERHDRSERSGRDRSNQGDRSSQGERSNQGDRSGYQDRRSRGPARDEPAVPGLEPQPDLTPGNVPAAADRAPQSELPLQGQEGQRRTPRGGRVGERNRQRSSESQNETQGRSEQPAPRPVTPRRAEPTAAPESAEPSLEDSIPAAIVPIESPAEETPAPRRRGRPRKRPVEETQSAASSDVPAAAPAPVADAAEPAPAPKRRGRPRKVVVEAAPASESEETSEGPNAANA